MSKTETPAAASTPAACPLGEVISIRTKGQRGQGTILGHFTTPAEADKALAYAAEHKMTVETDGKTPKDIIRRPYEPSAPTNFADWVKAEEAETRKAEAMATFKETNPEMYRQMVEAGVIKEAKPKAAKAEAKA